MLAFATKLPTLNTAEFLSRKSPAKVGIWRLSFATGNVMLLPQLDDDAIHLGADVGGQLVAVASFTPFAEGGTRDLASYQLRGAATREDFQGKGIGHKLIATGIEACFKRGASLVWCDGRSAPKTFYERLGFTPAGPEFKTSSGLHYHFRHSSYKFRDS